MYIVIQLYNLTFDDFPSLIFLPFNNINKKLFIYERFDFNLGLI